MENCVKALNAGGVIIFPTDTVYGLVARKDIPAATKKIYELKGRDFDKPLVRMVAQLDRKDELLKKLPGRAWRVLNALCPGPLTIVGEGRESLRWPFHDQFNELLRRAEGPVVCTSANLSGEKDANRLEDIPEAIRNGVDAIYDGGVCDGGVASTVMAFKKDGFEIYREGPIKKELIEYLWSYRLAFVCTGNTCRSPMVEALSKSMLAKELGCEGGDPIVKGIHVESAGIYASDQAPPSPQAVEVMAQQGLDLSQHHSSNVSHFMMYPPDLVFGMTANHVHMLNSMNIHAELLSKAGHDVPDPFGEAVPVYQKCAEQIQAFISERLPDWLEVFSSTDR